MLRLLLIVVCLEDVVYGSLNDKSQRMEECDHTIPNLELSTGKKLNPFQPFRFRANDFGATKFRLDALFQQQPVLNIRVANDALPDSVKGGNLDGSYSFFQSFLVTGNDVHSMDNSSFGLEMWNLYVKKNNAELPNSPHDIISINTLFKTEDTQYLRLNPILETIEKMTSERPSRTLPYNYDPYALLPRINSFVVYESNVLPFPYPKKFHNDFKVPVSDKKGNSCDNQWPKVKIFVSRKSQSISPKQLELLNLIRKRVDADNTRNGGQDSVSNVGRTGPQIHVTPFQEHQVILRSVSKAAASMMEMKKQFDGEAAQYPQECKFLEKIDDIVRRKNINSLAFHQRVNLFPIFCTLILSLLMVLKV